MVISCSQKPEFIRVDNVAITGLQDSLVLLQMDYIVYNPNDVKSQLKQSSMDIFYRDSLVGEGILEKQISLPVNDTVNVPVLCKITLEKLHQYYPEFLVSESAIFTVKGDSKVSFFLNSFTIKMDDEIRLNTKEIIFREIKKNISKTDNFKIQSIGAKKLPSFASTEMNLQILAKNNLPIDYRIEQMDLEIFMDNNEKAVAQWTLTNPLFQKAMGTVAIPVDVNLDNIEILKNAKLSWLTKRKANFSIFGNVEIKIKGYNFNVPIQDTINIAI